VFVVSREKRIRECSVRDAITQPDPMQDLLFQRSDDATPAGEKTVGIRRITVFSVSISLFGRVPTVSLAKQASSEGAVELLHSALRQ
jgi:hypothetical protein